MNKMKQNAFWVGVGVAVAAVAAIFVVWVWMGGWDEAATKSGQIKETFTTLRGLQSQPAIPSGKTGVPSSKDVEAWGTGRNRYIADYKDIAKVYEDRDLALEKWFNAKANPSPSEFFGPYNDAAKAIEEELRKKGIKIGYPSDDRDPTTDGKYGFNWGKPQDWSWDKLPEDEKKAAVRELQKRANICEMIKKALLVDGLKVDRLNDVYFFHALGDAGKFATGAEVRPGTTEGEIKYVNNPLESTAGNQRFNEYMLPDNGEKADKPENRKFLGKTLTFGFSVTMPYSEVPKLVREVLNSKVDMIVNVVGLRVVVAKQNKLNDEIIIVIPEGDPDRAKKEADAKAAKEKEIQAVPVQAWITCQVIDFESANKPAFAK